MNEIASHLDFRALLRIINASYPVEGKQMSLHRDLIGRVYFIDGPKGKFVFKLYRSFNTDNALQATSILRYLKESDYPAVRIIPTSVGEMSILVNTQEGLCVGVLYECVEGPEPDIETEVESIGRQVARLHNIMRDYPYSLINRTKDEYIDDYIAVMKEKDYAPARVAELQEYGDEIWCRLQELPRGFCHGDMHTGNMRRTEAGEYVLFDFDEASGDFPVMDVAYLSDDTNFNRFSESGYEQTLRRFDRFYTGYGIECSLSDAEVSAVLDFIPVRHYQILGRIIRCQGSQGISERFLDEQYKWLLDWRNLCEKKRS